MNSVLLASLVINSNVAITSLLVTPCNTTWWLWLIPSSILSILAVWYYTKESEQDDESLDYIELIYPTKGIGDIIISYDINGEYAIDVYTSFTEAIDVYSQLKKDYPTVSSRIVQGK